MEKQYYLHRISHEANVSYTLMRNGYLTLGWGEFSETDILDTVRNDDRNEFDKLFTDKGFKLSKSRWSMWIFGKMNVGDLVVVPLYDGLFSVFEVEEQAQSIQTLEDKIKTFKGEWNNHKYIWDNHRICDSDDNSRIVDLGFCIKVKPKIIGKPRDHATSPLISRMKIRNTNANITDIKDSVDMVIDKKEEAVSLYQVTMDKLENTLLNDIQNIIGDREFEQLIRWYLVKCGATFTKIPAKNEAGKEDGADADIVAEFENLKYIVYIQAKHHKKETSSWAVKQIKRYKEQMSDDNSEYTYASWVITSAEEFSKEAKAEAADEGNEDKGRKNKVRLIDGKEFARMLLDIGLLNLDQAFDKNLKKN